MQITTNYGYMIFINQMYKSRCTSLAQTEDGEKYKHSTKGQNWHSSSKQVMDIAYSSG